MKNYNILLNLCLAIFIVSLGNAWGGNSVTIGATRDAIIAAFGEPTGKMKTGNEEILTYPGGLIVLQDGIVSSIDDNFTQRLQERKHDKDFEKEQKKQGLVEYLGQWITPQKKNNIINEKKLAKKIFLFSIGGRELAIDKILVPGKITIVDFYADWCGPCKKMAPQLEKIALDEPEVYLRKVNIKDWGTPITKQHRIRAIPDVRVFTRKGYLVGKPTHNFNEIKQYVEQAKKIN